MPNNNNIWDAEVVFPLKYLSNFWSSLHLPLISCEIELDLKRTKNCVISKISRTSVVPANPTIPAVAATRIIGATFQINNTKLYVPVVALSVKDNIKFIENKRWI